MTRNKTLLLTFLMAFSTILPIQAQQKLFTLEDLNFGGNNFYNLLPKNLYLTWWGDKLMYLDAEEGGLHHADGTRSVSFQLSELGSDWHSAYEAEYPYADKPLVLLDNRRQRVLYNFEKHQTEWSQTSRGETHSDWNAQSKAVAYVKDNQLYVRTADNEAHKLTTDGSREIVYGQIVHRNEFGIEKGTFWSPDGRRLAFYRMDQSMVKDYPQVDIFHRMAELTPDKYPMAGETSHVVTVGIYDIETGKTLYLKTPTPNTQESTAVYFTNIAWSPDSKTVYMFELNRDQNDCRLVSYDALTGDRVQELYQETDSKYVEPLHPIQFLPWDDNLFLLQSQKDGYNHLYIYNKEGKLQKQLTKGNFVVMEVVAFDTKQKCVIIRANKEHPLCHNLYSVNVKNSRMTLLDNGRGVHYAMASASGSRLIDSYSEPDVPRKIDLIETSGRTTNLLTASDPWKDNGYQIPIFENGTLKAADGVTDLYWRMVKPADFDPQKKYPTVVYVYGGPHANNVQASFRWYSRSWETYMAQKGYIVFVLDNRGSQYRGKDFEQVTFRQLGQVEMQDQMEGVRYLKSLPYVDADKLGVHGWSFGGFMTISLMLNYPDVFKVGVAGGPVIDWKWYEVMYGERYMDTPQTNPEGYEKTSLIHKAKKLKGRLQIISGYNDDTVVLQHCLSFLAACIEAGTQPDFFVYPGEAHNMRGHQSVHLHERITRYFEDYLPVK